VDTANNGNVPATFVVATYPAAPLLLDELALAEAQFHGQSQTFFVFARSRRTAESTHEYLAEGATMSS
jgi:hypothetical protein